MSRPKGVRLEETEDDPLHEAGTPLTPEEWREHRRRELRNGLTDLQRLFLFGKLGGMNDKDAAIAAGYSFGVAENTTQRVWKPQVLAEHERIRKSLRVGSL